MGSLLEEHSFQPRGATGKKRNHKETREGQMDNCTSEIREGSNVQYGASSCPNTRQIPNGSCTGGRTEGGRWGGLVRGGRVGLG